MVLSMRECGKTISNTDMESKHGQTSQSMKESMLLAASTVSAAINGMMDPCTLVTGVRIKSLASVSTRGWMEDATKASGWTTTWKAWASTFGMMVECTKDSIRTTKNMVSECTHGQISVATKATGIRESNTGLEPMLYPRTTKLSLVSGRTANVSSGSTSHKSSQLTTAK